MDGYNMSRRLQDMNAEKELSIFLDNELYSNIEKNCPNMKWQRNNDKSLQLQGVDGYIISSDKKIIVDEKATLYYLGKNIPTFAFEINSYQNGRLTPGWLFDKNYLTNYYLLIYPSASNTDLATIKSIDFTQAQCILVKRNSIISYLERMGFNQARIENDAIEYRRRNQFGKINISGIEDFYYYLSAPSNYSEQPFNVIIRRFILEQLASHVYVIKQGTCIIEK